jgi:type II secretion system protein H
MPGRTRPAFTLIELILVMAMLSIVLSLAGPSLARFFRGRGLDSEARRFLALTRYGQSRAVSEGIPMLLWIDEQQRRFGLEAESSYLEEKDTKSKEYELSDSLQIEVEMPLTRVLTTQWKGTGQIKTSQRVIRFTPDGFITDTSPDYVVLRQVREGEEEAVFIGRNRNRLNYEIQTNEPPRLRR